MAYNGISKYCNDMKEKIREILIGRGVENPRLNLLTNELLDLFNVSGYNNRNYKQNKKNALTDRINRGALLLCKMVD